MCAATGMVDTVPVVLIRKGIMNLSELVIEIRNGRSDLLGELWNQVRDFVALMAIRRYIHVTDTGVDVDDLIQQGYFAVLEAVRTYDPAGEYGFLSWLVRPLRTAFNDACGTRWERLRKDPIHYAESLDAPLDEDEDTTLTDFLQASDDVEEDVVEKVFREQLHDAEERLLSRLSKAGADVVRSSYFAGEQIPSIAKRYHVDADTMQSRRSYYLMQLRQAARSTPEGKELRRFIDDSTNFYYAVNPVGFARTHESAVEHLVLYRDRLEQKYRHGLPE